MGNERSSMFQTSCQEVLAPFHAQEKLLTSSSWVSQVPNFRQEIRQSNYRNDPVKYDLTFSSNVRAVSMFPRSNMLWNAYKLHFGFVLAKPDIFCSSYNWWLKLTLILTWALTYVPWTCSIAATTPSFVNFVQLLQCSYHAHWRIGQKLSPEIIDSPMRHK